MAEQTINELTNFFQKFRKEEAKQKLSALHSKVVIQCDLEGNEINRFSSITEAEKIKEDHQH